MNEIGAKTGVGSDKLSGKNLNLIYSSQLNLSAHTDRILRYLASRHVFTELSPDIYANNRISSILAKTKPLEELKKEHVYYVTTASDWRV